MILDVTALAAGGDGVARDEAGRVTFVPRTAPGDRVSIRLVVEKKAFARGELLEVTVPSPDRVAPPCESFVAGCGGCAWQHVARPAQLAAKQAIVAGALRKLEVPVEPIADPCPPYGWRRRARFHVSSGKLGLYALGTHRVIPLAHCPQLEPGLDAVLAAVLAASPPDGELAVVRGHRGDVAVAVARPWRGAKALVGRARIVGVIAGDERHGEPTVELEPGLVGGPWEFAQASAAGNAALVATARAALGSGPGRLLELYAGSGNLTRGFRADGWDVVATDLPSAAHVVETVAGPFDAIVLDPPRTGAADAIAGIAKLAPSVIVYVSCDPATLARDASQLVAAGYRAERAWPLDVMPQTAHVEVVLRLVR